MIQLKIQKFEVLGESGGDVINVKNSLNSKFLKRSILNSILPKTIKIANDIDNVIAIDLVSLSLLELIQIHPPAE